MTRSRRVPALAALAAVLVPVLVLCCGSGASAALAGTDAVRQPAAAPSAATEATEAPATANATAPAKKPAAAAAAPAAAASNTTAAPGGKTSAPAPAANASANATTDAPAAPARNTTNTTTTTNSTAAAPPETPAPIPGGAQAPGSTIPKNGPATEPSKRCFPAHALATLASGELRRMDALAVGDRVLVAHKRYSEVFMFTHRQPGLRAEFVSIHTASGHRLSATPGHYLYVNGALAPAAAVAVGDHVSLGSGATSAVVAVDRSVESGIYNPQTLHGDIVVDGVVASTYTTAVSPLLGHAWLAPVRALYAAFGLTSSVLEAGADSAVAVVPGGSSVY